MNVRSWLFYLVVSIVVLITAAGCGAQPAPTAEPPAVTPEPVFIVVTATDVPPTPSPEVVFVVVTATPDAEMTTEAVEAESPPAADTPERQPTATAEPEVEAVAEAPEEETNETDAPSVEMSLAAQESTTQHSPRPASFVEPASLDEIKPYENWENLLPDESVDFQSYDGVRVVDGGEAVLDLGNLMKLILIDDSEMQFVPGSLVQEELTRIAVDFSASTPLEELVLAAHLLRGGFLGEKTVGSDPIALTTPNAVVVISGTEFFLAYDPEIDTTWVGKFEGTMSVADVALEEGEALADRQLIAIPAVRGRKYWPLHAHMTPDEFARLIRLEQSPIDAADMISGPYLRVIYDPELAVRGGPGVEFSYVGRLAQGTYARIIGRGRGWWQIECPPPIRASACWVSGGSAYTENYNLDIALVPVTAQRATATPTITPAPKPITITVTPDTQAPPGTSPGDVFDCSYIGNDKFEWYTAEGGPFTGIWQSGCPASPRISISGCTVSWDAGNDDVASATIRIEQDGTDYDWKFEHSEEFAASLPSGSRSFSTPGEGSTFDYAPTSGDHYYVAGSGYYAAKVTAFFNLTLKNGVQESKKTSKVIEIDNYGDYKC